jgi:hypothetical protein
LDKMNRITRIALAATAVAAIAGGVAATAHADGRWSMGKGVHGDGERHGGRMMRLFESFDANGDGALTQEEIDASRSGRFAKFDGNADKALTLEEYQALWLDAMHERMVRSFQRLDTDGDARVTAEEFGAPFARMVAHADHNGDGKLDRDDRPARGMGRHGDDDDGREHRKYRHGHDDDRDRN